MEYVSFKGSKLKKKKKKKKGDEASRMGKAYFILPFFLLYFWPDEFVFKYNFSSLYDLCVLAAYGDDTLILS